MSSQDFALSVLASIVAAVICHLSKYVCPTLIRFLHTTKALTYRANLKMYDLFDFYRKIYSSAAKPYSYYLVRRFLFSPVTLCLILIVLLMILTPFTASRINEQNGLVSLRRRVESLERRVASLEKTSRSMRSLEAIARSRLNMAHANEIVVPLE
jgi:cell division protein FtsB